MHPYEHLNFLNVRLREIKSRLVSVYEIHILNEQTRTRLALFIVIWFSYTALGRVVSERGEFEEVIDVNVLWSFPLNWTS